MLFLGIDQSLRSTGIALVKQDSSCFAVRTIIGRKIKGAARLDLIRREAAAFVDAGNASPYGPVVNAAMEGGSFKSVHRGFDLGAVFGVLQADLFARGLDPVVVAPVLVKKFITGKAFADKPVVMNAVKTTWNIEFDDDNQADAIVLAMIARALFLNEPQYYRHSLEVLRTLRAPPAASGPRVRIRSNFPNV